MDEVGHGDGARIEGVFTFPLRVTSDDLGAVMHMLRADSPGFEGFGEIYFSVVRSGAIKAWKRHHRMVQNFAVPVGAIRLVIYDSREDSPTRGAIKEVRTGLALDRYELVRIPPMVWYGFQGLGTGDSLIANCASIAHDPNEVDRAHFKGGDVPYVW